MLHALGIIRSANVQRSQVGEQVLKSPFACKRFLWALSFAQSRGDQIFHIMSAPTSSKQSAWEKTKSSSKKWFDKVGTPVNKAANKVGAESFWPTSLDKESDKAARILRSFCIDGFVADHGNGQGGHEEHRNPLDRIPVEVRLSLT